MYVLIQNDTHLQSNYFKSCEDNLKYVTIFFIVHVLVLLSAIANNSNQPNVIQFPFFRSIFIIYNYI